MKRPTAIILGSLVFLIGLSLLLWAMARQQRYIAELHQERDSLTASIENSREILRSLESGTMTVQTEDADNDPIQDVQQEILDREKLLRDLDGKIAYEEERLLRFSWPR